MYACTFICVPVAYYTKYKAYYIRMYVYAPAHYKIITTEALYIYFKILGVFKTNSYTLPVLATKSMILNTCYRHTYHNLLFPLF